MGRTILSGTTISAGRSSSQPSHVSTCSAWPPRNQAPPLPLGPEQTGCTTGQGPPGCVSVCVCVCTAHSPQSHDKVYMHTEEKSWCGHMATPQDPKEGGEEPPQHSRSSRSLAWSQHGRASTVDPQHRGVGPWEGASLQRAQGDPGRSWHLPARTKAGLTAVHPQEQPTCLLAWPSGGRERPKAQ